MLNLTLQQLFGANATQNAQSLIIHKADLPRLFTLIDNRGEQLLAAILLQAHTNFEGVITDEQNTAIINEQGKIITFDNKELYKKLSIEYWKQQYTRSIILNTFIVKVFITPPPPLNTLINIDDLE